MTSWKKIFPIVLTGGAVAFVYAAGLISNNADTDLWGYLAFGHEFWSKSGFPYQDVFSYMPVNDVWVYHEWLTGVIFFPLYMAFGDESLQILRYALALGALMFAFKTARLRGAPVAWALLGLFFAAYAVSPGYSPVRAQVFTHFFFCLLIYVCEKSLKEDRYKGLWILAPVFLFWGNAHGGFVAGLGILLLYAVGAAASGRKWTPFALAMAASIAATLINPYGIKYWSYLIHALSMPRTDITEWASIREAFKQGYKVLSPHVFSTLFLISAVLYARRIRKDPTAILILAATAWMAFSHVRHIVFFGFAFAALAPDAAWNFFNSLKTNKFKKRRLAGILILLPASWMLYLSLNVAYHRMGENDFTDAPLSLKVLSAEEAKNGQFFYPVGGMHYLRQNNISGNILPEFSWGEFIMWSLPDSKIAIDGRYETVYPTRTCEQYFDFLNKTPGWESYLNDYPHEIAVFRPNSYAAHLIDGRPEWKNAYMDQGCVVFIKEEFNLQTRKINALE